MRQATLLLSVLILILLPANSFDLDTGNAAFEIVVPLTIEITFQDVSANAGDASLVLRSATLLTNAWFDAVAPFHPTAVGVYSRFSTRIN